MTTPAYPCNSAPEIPEGHYSRLCPCELRDWAGHDETQLKILACYMKDSPEKREARATANQGITTMPSGYVYFGQFIDHDITRDNRSLDHASPDVANTRNYRTAQLDLDHLYGKDPESVPCIYRTDGERLKLGRTLESQGIDGHAIPCSWNDLPRTSDGTAIVVDPRNDENLILAQLHVLFAKFHNRVLKLLKNQPALSPGPAPGSGTSLFRQARRFVTWHYQWILVNDFLPRILRLAVLDDIKKAGSQPRLFSSWYTPKDDPVALPVEFSVAAFRFGHSVVRGQYDLNHHVGGVNSSEILRMTRRGGGINTQLPANYVIEWDRFFAGTSGQMNLAEEIDTSITEMLYNVPKQTEEAFRFQSSLRISNLQPSHLEMRPPLPELTLRRGSKIRLPCGEEFAAKFKYNPIEPAALFPGQTEFFECGLKGRTPLWYYLLREAAVEPNPEPPGPRGQLQKLGTIGSRIVAETLYQLLNADCQSIAHAGCGWNPPAFTFGPAGEGWRLHSMADLVRFANEKP